MTNAERAVWMDFLALAAINDPPGQVDFISEKRLANQLNISTKLLKSAIKKALAYGKIDLEENEFGSGFNEKREKLKPTCDQLDIKNTNLGTTQSKIGLTLRSIKILKWDEYQSEYMRQKPYREKEGGDKKEGQGEDEKLQNPGPKIVTQVTDRGEERRREEIREDKNREDEARISSSSSESELKSPLPSNSNSFNKGEITIKDKFLSMLKNCKDYPFDEAKDSLLFDFTVTEYPNINIIKQTEKKLAWWKEHPEALKANPRDKLQNWFKEEAEFQKRGGPQRIGEILAGIKDKDHRGWIMGLLRKNIK